MTLGLYKKRIPMSIGPSRTPGEEIVRKTILSDRETFYALDHGASEIRKHNQRLKVGVYNVLRLPLEKPEIIMSKKTRETLLAYKAKYAHVLQQAFGG